jgi:hypothetical protein
MKKKMKISKAIIANSKFAKNINSKNIKRKKSKGNKEIKNSDHLKNTLSPNTKFKMNNSNKLMDFEPITIVFKNSNKNSLINKFRPNLTPRQIFQLGSFGGSYWRPIYSGVLKKKLENQHMKYKNINDPFTGKEENWWEGISDNLLIRSKPDLKLNKYNVHSGTTLEYWEEKNWINSQDPYGWVQWYCEFYSGRRSDDDDRQIQRWLNFAGPKGRFYLRLINMIKAAGTTHDDITISPVIRQGLQHWGVMLTRKDVDI